MHLYAYLGVGLSIPHEIWTGSDFATSSLARVYWWSAYALALGAILVYRLGLPVWRTLRHGISVSSVIRESSDVVTVLLTEMLTAELVQARAPIVRQALPDRSLLEAVMHGLQRL